MFFNQKEQFVLANIAIGMLQAAYSEHIISETLTYMHNNVVKLLEQI